MAKIILGIDPGIADTGYGLIKEDRGRLMCLAYGSIKTSAKSDLISRLDDLYRQLDVIIKEHKPQLAAVEQLFFNKNVKTALIVGQARGVALLALKRNNLPIIEFTPSQIKQAVAAYGQAAKRQVQQMVKLTLCLDCLPQPDDAADALAAAICASNSRLCPRN